MSNNENTTPSADDFGLTYSELNFAEASQTPTIHTAAEPETTYSPISIKSQSVQQNPGSEATPGKDQRQQEKVGGTDSKKSRCLGLVVLLIIISLLAITIGLTVYVLQLTQDLSACKNEQHTSHNLAESLNTSLADSLRNLSEMCLKLKNVSATLSQTEEKASSLCDNLKNLTEPLCPSDWKLHNQTCYRFSIAKVNWDTAKRECESQNSQLLIINTQQEKNFVIQSMPNKNEHYFIGLTDQRSEGNWTWVDGAPVSHSDWLKNQPDNTNNEHCGTFSKENGGDRFGFNDIPCDRDFQFICEKPAPSWIGAAAFEKYCP